MAKAAYHHGDLRAALINAALEITADRGADQVSVAEVARRAGVSGGAPYRHFADRRALMTAVAAQAARSLTRAIAAAVADAGAGADGQLLAAGRIYVSSLIHTRAGIDVIYAAEISGRGDAELTEAGRALTDLLTPLVLAVRPDYPSALRLMDQVLAICHGYAALYLSGFLNRSTDALDVISDRTADAIKTLTASAT